MSKLLNELIGKKIAINTNVIGSVGVLLAVDEDWVKIELDNKKSKKIRLIPRDSIVSIDLQETETV